MASGGPATMKKCSLGRKKCSESYFSRVSESRPRSTLIRLLAELYDGFTFDAPW
jgi:hypothetical protein